MLKIDKHYKISKNFHQFLFKRQYRNEKCCKSQGSTYYCVQPEEDPIFDYEKYKRENVHPMLRERIKKDYRPWKNLFLFVCLPVIIIKYLDIKFIHPEKIKRPKFVEYSYLRIRKQPFPPWDPDRSLFHNPRYNALPTGYEYEVPEDEEYDP